MSPNPLGYLLDPFRVRSALLHHPDCVESAVSRVSLLSLTPYVHMRSLFEVMRKAGRPSVRLTRSAAVSVARGMAYLHSRQPPILHKDLKSPNILVDANWRIKVAHTRIMRLLPLSQFLKCCEVTAYKR